jgi:hypothetical protein
VTSALPIAAYLNRNPQSFGTFIGKWVACRYLDVGPCRLLQRLYDTPAKQAARPWAQYLNWVTIVAIYIGAFFAVFYKQILFAQVPAASVPEYVPANWEVGVVIGVNFALARWEWIAIRQYTDSLLAAAGVPQKVTAAHY